ncbi:MAG: sigma-70 family RNA polymerase sigma factor, partial [Clostridia bacterium]|nr:sigma-70 family RNA polymerase sigma factor [Clostridia bacterium]
ALARARATAVMSALGSLPPSARQVVVLHYYHGLSVAEIAAALGCAEGTVKSRLWRARARLAEALREERGAADA